LSWQFVEESWLQVVATPVQLAEAQSQPLLAHRLWVVMLAQEEGVPRHLLVEEL
jgi:hypothetical protein